MPLIDKIRIPGFEIRMSDFSRCALWTILLLGFLALSGCASTPKKPPLSFTGDMLVDGPNAIANGPAKDKILWEYRTAAAAMRRGQFALAKQMLDDALLTIGGITVNDKSAKQSRSYFHGEAKKMFLGEPYERAMAYIYRGILYWMDGEPDNARACFRSAEFVDSDAEKHEYAGDWVLPDYLDGLVTTKLGGEASDVYNRAKANAKGITLPPYNPKANVLFFVEFGPGPTKFGTGEYGEQLRFGTPPCPVNLAEIKVDSMIFPVAPSDDVAFQATTRGGRVMDHVLGNKAVFKTTTDVAGTAAIIGGITTAAVSHDRTAQQVGLGIALAGLVSKAISAATVAEADIRTWDNLPRYLSFANMSLPPGQHAVTVQFKDPSGNIVPSLTKNLTINVPSDGKDKVVFVSDQSLTPQTL
jgi:hypothetical protein